MATTHFTLRFGSAGTLKNRLSELLLALLVQPIAQQVFGIAAAEVTKRRPAADNDFVLTPNDRCVYENIQVVTFTIQNT